MDFADREFVTERWVGSLVEAAEEGWRDIEVVAQDEMAQGQGSLDIVELP
jgi:hypothetical protein